MKQKVTIEIEVPEGYTITENRPPKFGEHLLLNGYILECIEPQYTSPRYIVVKNSERVYTDTDGRQFIATGEIRAARRGEYFIDIVFLSHVQFWSESESSRETQYDGYTILKPLMPDLEPKYKVITGKCAEPKISISFFDPDTNKEYMFEHISSVQYNLYRQPTCDVRVTMDNSNCHDIRETSAINFRKDFETWKKWKVDKV